MADRRNALVFLPETQDVAGLWRGWPESIELALLLQSNGGATAVAFKGSDRAWAMNELVASEELGTSDVVVYPEVEGYPTLDLRFSDEQKLLTILQGADREALLGSANDLEINRRFAEEEGLESYGLSELIRVSVCEPRVEAKSATVADDHPLEFSAQIRRVGGYLLLVPENASALSPPVAAMDASASADLGTMFVEVPGEASEQTVWSIPTERLPCAALPMEGEILRAQVITDGRSLRVDIKGMPAKAKARPEQEALRVHRGVVENYEPFVTLTASPPTCHAAPPIEGRAYVPLLVGLSVFLAATGSVALALG